MEEALTSLAVTTFIITAIILSVLVIIAYWAIFQKAGEKGWKSIIPIYSVLVLLKIAGRPWWLIFLFVTPYVNIIAHILTSVGLAKQFGKGTAFTLGLIFFPMIFAMILGLGNAQYTPPAAEEII